MQRGNSAALDLEFVKALAVSSRLVLPVGDGSLVEAEGGDDGLQGAAVAEQGEHRRGQCDGLVEAVVGGVAGGGEGLAAGGTAIALLAAGGGADGGEAAYSPVQAVEVGAELSGRVHRVFLRGSGCIPPRIRDGPVPLNPLLQLHGCLGCYRTTGGPPSTITKRRKT